MGRDDGSGDDALKKSLQAANTVKSAIKTGKAIAGIAKGASVGGPYGAVAGLLWESRGLLKKLLPVIILLFMLPVLFITMLPSVIFNGFNAHYDNPILNNDAAIIENIEEAKNIIQDTLSGRHERVVVEIQGKIANLPEGSVGQIIPAYGDDRYNDAILIISQYCVSKDNFVEINLSDLRSSLSRAGNSLYSYSESVTTETVETDDGEVTTTIHTYAIAYSGDDYFASNVFNLSDEKRLLANDYAQNLMLFLYGSSFASGGYANVSAEVLAYEGLIIQYAEKYGISQYVEVIKAIMMQESGGRVADVMQSSECAYNLDYPKRPNGITDPEYSIDAGIHYFADALSMAGCTSPSDLSKLSLALQGYNYGTGYITWAKSNYGGYTESNALAFSSVMKVKYGWTTYGDPQYVAHVLRYYMFEGIGGAEGWGSPFVGKDWRKAVSSEYGSRTDPVTGQTGAFHEGLDIAYPKGTLINAVKGGVVTTAVKQSSGYGYHIVVDHGDGTTALYGHCSELLVTQGQTVQSGQTIAKVGTTGKSTGNHLHLTIKENGALVNPRNYIK